MGCASTKMAKALEDGIVAHWRFDEGEGTVAYDSASSNNGSLIGDTNWVDGISGKALYFDGSGDYVDVPNYPDLNPTNAITVAAWFKVNSFPGTWPPILKKHDDTGPHHGYTLECHTNPEGQGPAVHISARLDGGGQCVSDHVTIDSSKWHFVAGIYDGSVCNLYLDGVPSTPRNFTGNLDNSSYNLNIGRDPSNTSRFFDGIIDEVRIYNRALTSAEIEYLYQNP